MAGEQVTGDRYKGFQRLADLVDRDLETVAGQQGRLVVAKFRDDDVTATGAFCDERAGQCSKTHFEPRVVSTRAECVKRDSIDVHHENS